MKQRFLPLRCFNPILLVRWPFLLLVSILFPICHSASAQTNATHLSDHKPLMNPIWEVIDKLMYKVSKENGKTIYTPHFPAELQRLDGKEVTLKGYMVPIKPGRSHHFFLLSVLPIYQCMFCGQNGIPPMVEINMVNEKKVIFTDQVTTIRGKIYLNAKDSKRTEVQIH
ncbi:hypothetical protein FAZ15_17060 [Sphingobacterium olei]|uniref:DUF3299 domain-containing protein n=1 Tax=Sphingobacterium olei TaxID=2571155 RepID=A0A4U0NU06_9SPHI|nr:hypothetical protein [Sphingobacterium olei]TJZ53734.1 hypothetical protein FAZ15_17060 [Sphingobacterium olei]